MSKAETPEQKVAHSKYVQAWRLKRLDQERERMKNYMHEYLLDPTRLAKKRARDRDYRRKKRAEENVNSLIGSD